MTVVPDWYWRLTSDGVTCVDLTKSIREPLYRYDVQTFKNLRCESTVAQRLKPTVASRTNLIAVEVHVPPAKDQVDRN